MAGEGEEASAQRYRVEFLPSAARELARLPHDAQPRGATKIGSLESDPRPPGCKALKGQGGGVYRVRRGDYRIVYGVDDQARLVTITKVGNRRDVYRR